MGTDKRRDERPEPAPSRDRRLDEVFGEVLPETTSDEREPPAADARRNADDWYYDNRPPHHGR